MTTSTDPHTSTDRSGFGFWKVLAIVVVAIIALSMIGPLLKGLFWIAVIALAGYGGYMLFRASRSGDTHPKPF